MTRAAGGGRRKGGDLPVAVPSNQLLTRAPKVPDEFAESPTATSIWKQTVKILIDRQHLTADHLPLVFTYCDSFDLYLRARKAIADEGFVANTEFGIKKHPAVAVRQDALSSLLRAGSLLGLDPMSYRRLMVGGGAGSGDGGNEFEEF